MSGNTAATWKTVSTLEWKKKQKAPAEPKGFGAILDAAADVVVDKWTAGALVPAYSSRLSEIQIQDEAYIHQQLVKPEESKIKRGLQRLISIGKSKAGKGMRILRPGGATSRKVRFNEDPHSSKPATGQQQQPGAVGTAAADVGAVKGSGISRKAAAAPGALKSGLRFADPPSAAAAKTSSAAAGAKEARIQAAHTGSSQSSDEARSKHPASSASSSSDESKPSVALQLQQPSSSGTGSGGAGASIYTSSNGSCGSSGEGSAASGMMAAYLQQQSTQQPPQTPSFAAGSMSGNWEGVHRTELADKQLQRLRTTMAPPATPAAAAAAEQLDFPLGYGYRPLSIPEETFERWSSVAGGGSGAVGSSRQARMSLDMAPVPAGAAAANSAGASGARCSARRGSKTGNMPATQPDAGQTGNAQLGRRSSKEINIPLQLAGSSSSPDLVAAAAAATAGGGASSSHSSGDATNSKQRRTTDYLSTLSSVEASLHPTRRSGGRAGSPSSNTPGSGDSGSPSQHPSTPRSRHSSSSITAAPHTPAAGSSAVPVSVSKATRSSSLLDAQQLAQQQQQRSPSPFKSGAAVAGAGVLGSSAATAGVSAGASGRSSRPNSTIRGSSMSQDATSSAGRARVATPPGGSSRGGSSSSPGATGAGSRTSSGMLDDHQQGQQRRSSASTAFIGMTGKSSSSLLHLPVISKPAANKKLTAASSTAAKK